MASTKPTSKTGTPRSSSTQSRSKPSPIKPTPPPKPKQPSRSSAKPKTPKTSKPKASSTTPFLQKPKQPPVPPRMALKRRQRSDIHKYVLKRELMLSPIGGAENKLGGSGQVAGYSPYTLS